MTHRQFTAADYETALVHEISRLEGAVKAFGLTARGRPSFRYISARKGVSQAYWSISLLLADEYADEDEGDRSELRVTGNAPTLGAAFEAAHMSARQIARNLKQEAAA